MRSLPFFLMIRRFLTLLLIPRTALGLVIAVIESIVVVGFFILIVIDAVAIFISIFRHHRDHSKDIEYDESGLPSTPPNEMRERTRRSGSITLADHETLGGSPSGNGGKKKRRFF